MGLGDIQPSSRLLMRLCWGFPPRGWGIGLNTWQMLRRWVFSSQHLSRNGNKKGDQAGAPQLGGKGRFVHRFSILGSTCTALNQGKLTTVWTREFRERFELAQARAATQHAFAAARVCFRSVFFEFPGVFLHLAPQQKHKPLACEGMDRTDPDKPRSLGGVGKMTHRKTARVVGALFILATVPFSISVGILTPLLEAPDFLTNVAQNQGRVGAGLLLELVNHIAVVGIAVIIYPVLKPAGERLALGYVAARSVEAALFAVTAPEPTNLSPEAAKWAGAKVTEPPAGISWCSVEGPPNLSCGSAASPDEIGRDRRPRSA